MTEVRHRKRLFYILFFVICGDGMCMWINSNCKQMYLCYVHIFWNKYGLSWTSKPIYSLCTCVGRHVCNGILQNQSTLLLLYLPLRLLLYLSFLGTEHYYNFFIEEISSIFYITNVKRDISYCRVKNTNKPSSGVGVFNCNRSCNELGTSWPKWNYWLFYKVQHSMFNGMTYSCYI